MLKLGVVGKTIEGLLVWFSWEGEGKGISWFSIQGRTFEENGCLAVQVTENALHLLFDSYFKPFYL